MGLKVCQLIGDDEYVTWLTFEQIPFSGVLKFDM